MRATALSIITAAVLCAAAVAAPTPVVMVTRTVTVTTASSGMEPTLRCALPASGCTAAVADQVVIREPSGQLRRGAIVAFHAPPAAMTACGSAGIYLSRLVGLPGDTWAERDGFVYINGRRLVEPYVTAARRDSETLAARTVPAGRYFVMGDNRAGSCDSSRWGTVPRAGLIGAVTKILRST